MYSIRRFGDFFVVKNAFKDEFLAKVSCPNFAIRRKKSIDDDV
jgi:hypothetical protein